MSETNNADEKSRHDSMHGVGVIKKLQGPSKPQPINFLLTAIYWIAWLITVVSDILLGVRDQFWPGQLFIESPIIRYIYTKHIDRQFGGGYYILEPFFTRWNTTIITTFIISTTLCTLLQITLAGPLRPASSYVSESLTMIWIAACMLLGTGIGLTKHERSVIALPFGWLSARTVQLICLHREFEPAEISDGRGRAAQVGSMLLFFVVYVGILGVTLDMIAILVLLEGTRLAWSWFKSTKDS